MNQAAELSGEMHQQAQQEIEVDPADPVSLAVRLQRYRPRREPFTGDPSPSIAPDLYNAYSASETLNAINSAQRRDAE